MARSAILFAGRAIELGWREAQVRIVDDVAVRVDRVHHGVRGSGRYDRCAIVCANAFVRSVDATFRERRRNLPTAW
jgi:hypothetical protein